MRILMLGWEFPPFITGGLGVACYGLTRALDRLGHEVIFVLPRAVDGAAPTRPRLLAPAREQPHGRTRGRRAAAAGQVSASLPAEVMDPAGTFRHVEFRAVEAAFSSSYPGFHPGSANEPGDDYAGDLTADAERYARLVVTLARHERFDVIHAHDWLTFPAGIAISRVTGRPLVVHVHSTEFDRSGEHANRAICDIERRGLHSADRVIVVSGYTRTVCIDRYGVPADKIDVVYNGIDRAHDRPPQPAHLEAEDKVVLFLGRLTMQKGPEYFLAAARRVLEKMPNVKFVVAGWGDMAHQMIESAAQMGIGHRVLFTGFLRGRDVERIFRMADCFVMPSVSEPFGIAALEAVQHEVPVILSRQSGVSEVLRHVLKVDFWDVDDMANKIVAVLRHPPLRETLRHHGPVELRWLTWDGAAERCVQTYAHAIHDRAMGHA